MITQNFDALYQKGYRPKRFTFLTPNGKGDPVGVGLFEKAGEFFESVVYERGGDWIYATPEKLVR